MSVSKLQRNAFETWQHLKKYAGIDEKFYDTDLSEHLKERLNLSEDGRLDALLKKYSVTNEQFLKAFFHVAQPYALMANDILTMFSQAGAKETTDNIAIEFDFNRKIDGLRFNLEDFRQFRRQLQKARRLIRARLWNENALLKVHSIFSNYMGTVDTLELGDRSNDWLMQIREFRQWPNFFPPRRIVGIPELDKRFEIFWNLVREVAEEIAKFGQQPWDLYRATMEGAVLVEDPERAEGHWVEDDSIVDEDWSARLLRGPDSDHWADNTFEGLRNCIIHFQRLARDDIGEDVNVLIERMDRLLESVAIISKETENLEEILIDFLQLPIWKRRHEVYGIWVGVRIIMAIGFDRCRIFHQNGVLRFSFGGSHIAAVRHPNIPLHLLSELRTPARKKLFGKGRKEAIQPDYRLIREPILAPESGVLGPVYKVA